MPTEVDNGFTGECFPELFDITARPKVTKQKPGQLSEEEIQQYFEKVSINCAYKYMILYFPNQGPWRAWYNIYN